MTANLKEQAEATRRAPGASTPEPLVCGSASGGTLDARLSRYGIELYVGHVPFGYVAIDTSRHQWPESPFYAMRPDAHEAVEALIDIVARHTVVCPQCGEKLTSKYADEQSYIGTLVAHRKWCPHEPALIRRQAQ